MNSRLPQPEAGSNLFRDRLNWNTTLHMAVRALRRNKLRSTLTILGITIGIGAVICTVAIGQGGSQMIHNQLEGLGTNMVWIEAGARNVNGVQTGNIQTKSLRVEDAKAIQDSVPLVASVAPNVDGPLQVVYGNQNWSTHYRGVSPEYFGIRRWTVSEGTLFTQQDVEPHDQRVPAGKNRGGHVIWER